MSENLCFKIQQNEKVRRYFIGDVLGIPAEEIRTVRLGHTFLWRRLRRHKSGILDVLVELNDDSKVNVELQIKMISHWDRRSLFYLAKTFTEELLAGEEYRKLKRCICISILDFDLDKTPEYHKIYWLRDKGGHDFSDLFEVHILELGKPLNGTGDVENWIRLINAATEEELDMIQTKNPGIIEAVHEVKRMSLRKELYVLYEAHLKEKRDRKAREDYVRTEGITQGKAEAVLMLLERKGSVPEKQRNTIYAQEDTKVLDQWLILAAASESAEEFWKQADWSINC